MKDDILNLSKYIMPASKKETGKGNQSQPINSNTEGKENKEREMLT